MNKYPCFYSLVKHFFLFILNLKRLSHEWSRRQIDAYWMKLIEEKCDSGRGCQPAVHSLHAPWTG